MWLLHLYTHISIFKQLVCNSISGWGTNIWRKWMHLSVCIVRLYCYCFAGHLDPNLLKPNAHKFHYSWSRSYFQEIVKIKNGDKIGRFLFLFLNCTSKNLCLPYYFEAFLRAICYNSAVHLVLICHVYHLGAAQHLWDYKVYVWNLFYYYDCFYFQYGAQDESINLIKGFKWWWYLHRLYS